jgi:pimeloyl-ACP methyl ester carboxylesterase
LDPRFSYLAYHPPGAASSADPLQMLVTIHGSDHRHEEMCRFFSRLADETHCIVLAPLLVPGSSWPDPDGYKFLRSEHAHYDRLLLDMIDEAGARFGAHTQRFFLYGFSGGAQFAHRFFYIYPQRLHALGIAAPGMVTLIDSTREAWVGTQRLRALCGHELDRQQLPRICVQLSVGDRDTTPHFGALGAAAYNHAGLNRLERLRTLAANYRAHGISVEHRELAGVGHDFEPLGAAAVPFLREQIRRAHNGRPHPER